MALMGGMIANWQAHNDGRKRQNRGESPIDLTVDMDNYHECKRLIARFRAQNLA